MNPRLALVTTALAAIVSSVTPWQAADAASGLQARIYLTQKGVPRSLSESGVIRFAQSNRATRLRESAEVPIEDRQWRATLVARFNQPVGDSEFEVLFYDIQTAERKFIAPAMTVFVNDRNQRTISRGSVPTRTYTGSSEPFEALLVTSVRLGTTQRASSSVKVTSPLCCTLSPRI